MKVYIDDEVKIGLKIPLRNDTESFTKGQVIEILDFLDNDPAKIVCKGIMPSGWLRKSDLVLKKSLNPNLRYKGWYELVEEYGLCFISYMANGYNEYLRTHHEQAVSINTLNTSISPRNSKSFYFKDKHSGITSIEDVVTDNPRDEFACPTKDSNKKLSFFVKSRSEIESDPMMKSHIDAYIGRDWETIQSLMGKSFDQLKEEGWSNEMLKYDYKDFPAISSMMGTGAVYLKKNKTAVHLPQSLLILKLNIDGTERVLNRESVWDRTSICILRPGSL